MLHPNISTIKFAGHSAIYGLSFPVGLQLTALNKKGPGGKLGNVESFKLSQFHRNKNAMSRDFFSPPASTSLRAETEGRKPAEGEEGEEEEEGWCE